MFKAIGKRINAETVKKVQASYRFDITPDGGGSSTSYIIDLRSGEGEVKSASKTDKADCTLALTDSDFVALMTGKLNPQAAFMKGKLKVKGNIMLAQKLSALMPPKPTKPKQQQPASSSGAAAASDSDKLKSRL